MSDFLLAVTSVSTYAEIFEPFRGDRDFEIRVAHTPGDALAILEQSADCRLVVLEREIEPQLGPLVGRIRGVRPGLQVIILGVAVGDRVRTELRELRVELLDRSALRADVLHEVRSVFRRSVLQSRAGIVGLSSSIHEILETVLHIGPTDIPVLITGPSGSGKELVARALYTASRRADRSFVALNVGALAESVLESELFGHEKGAFTGAVARKAGVFERADGGTLFLDEVGEMSQHMQVRLLRALDLGEILPVGGTATLKVDVRLLAATNRSLEDAVHRGTFREDLYYRLKVVHIEVPGLASRREDLPDLIGHFLIESRRVYGTSAHRVSPQALAMLQEHDWPGNVRELRNVVHSMAVLAKGRTLETSDVPAPIRDRQTSHLPVATHITPEQAERDILLQSLLALRHDLQEVLRLLRGGTREPALVVESNGEVSSGVPRSLRQGERELIQDALSAVGGNRRLAAQRLGIAERTLYRKLKEFGLS